MKTPTLFTFLLVCMVHIAYAQNEQEPSSSKSEQKVVIVKKQNVNGKVIEERQELEGKEAEEYMRKDMEPRSVKRIVVREHIETSAGESDYVLKVIQRAQKGEEEVMIFSDPNMVEHISPDDIATVDVIKNEKENSVTVVLKDGVAFDISSDQMNQTEQTVKIITDDGQVMTMIIEEDAVEEDVEVIISIDEDRIEEIIENEVIVVKEPVAQMSSGCMSREVSRDPKEAYLGVELKQEGDRIMVSRVLPDSPAETAGLKEGDQILKIGKVDIFDFISLRYAMRLHEAGEDVKIRVERFGKKEKLSAVLSSYPGAKASGNSINKDVEITIISDEEGDVIIDDFKGELSLQDLQVFPNPADDVIQVQFEAGSDNSQFIVSLLDSDGKEIIRQEERGFKGQYNQAIDVSSLKEGTVYIRIQANGQTSTTPVIIVR